MLYATFEGDCVISNLIVLIDRFYKTKGKKSLKILHVCVCTRMYNSIIEVQYMLNLINLYKKVQKIIKIIINMDRKIFL